MHEAETKTQELPPIEKQLDVTIDFINKQLEAAEPWNDHGWSEGVEVEKKDLSPQRLPDGTVIYLKSKTTITGEELDYLKFGYQTRNGEKTSLYINSDGTVEFFSDKDDKSLFDYENMPRDQAFKNPDFIHMMQSIYRIITVEAVKPKRPFVPHPLLDSVVTVEVADETGNSPEKSTILITEVGYSERPKKGQDAALVDKQQNLYGVFDGVGGEKGDSKVASRLAAKTIQDFMDNSSAEDPESVLKDLVSAISEADLTIQTWAENTSTDPGATTATVAKMLKHAGSTYLAWASVGDSRLYIKEPSGKLVQVSKDEGEREVLKQAVGKGFDSVKQSGIIKLAKDSDVVLVTDGITGDYESDILSDNEILFALDETPAQKATDYLVAIARKRDDRTAIVIRY